MGKRAIMGDLEYAVICAILDLEPNAYGVPIRHFVSEMLKRQVHVGEVYVTLSRLREKRYISSEESIPQPVRGGRSKVLYRVEGMGADAKRTKEEAEVSLGDLGIARRAVI